MMFIQEENNLWSVTIIIIITIPFQFNSIYSLLGRVSNLGTFTITTKDENTLPLNYVNVNAITNTTMNSTSNTITLRLRLP